jgi:hypothetical protein
MKITKNIISRAEALKISPQYVAYVEGDSDQWDFVFNQFEKATRGKRALTAVRGEGKEMIFITGKISSVGSMDDFRAVDGPVVRFGNSEYTWRVDGDQYAFLY